MSIHGRTQTASEPVPFVDLRAQYRQIEREIREALDGVLSDATFVLGPAVTAFEAAFAQYLNVEHCVAVSSGTAALHLALLASDVGPGDEVILPAHTFIATAWAVSYVGATPVFVDVDPTSFSMDPKAVAAAITTKTRAIIPVHIYGQSADMDPILEIARANRLRVIEDAAQAHGARYKGNMCGSMGDLAAFSFYPGKNLGGCGEGGAVVTNDGAAAERIRMLRDHSQRERYVHECLGFNYRMDGIQGAVLGVKLRHLDDWNTRRREVARLYDAAFATMSGARTVQEAPGRFHIYHLYELLLPSEQHRNGLMAHLRGHGVAAGLHYPIPVHLQKAYARFGFRMGDFPESERVSRTSLSLPMYAELSEDQVRCVIKTVRDWLRSC